MTTPRTSSKLKGLIAAVIELVQVRLQLLTLEAREEVARLMGMLVFGAATFLLLHMFILVMAFGVIACNWDTPHRMLTIWLVAAVVFVLAAVSGFFAYTKFKQGSQLFASSLQELRDDVERLQS